MPLSQYAGKYVSVFQGRFFRSQEGMSISIARLIVMILVLTALCGSVLGDEFHVIPHDVDPPIRVDGDLGDWDGVPNPITLDQAEHATWGKDTWTGTDDLSGTMRLAWLSTGILIAADVTDDEHVQPYSGMDIYRGDHVNLWIDVTPGLEPQRTAFGQGQFHLVVSPGNFAAAEGKQVIPPEVFFYVPENMASPGCEVAARRTTKGYVVEAFVPFMLLKLEGVHQGRDVNFEVAISDSDSVGGGQQAFMTHQTRPWVYGRHRLMPMVFGDGNGRGSLPPRAIPLLERAEIPVKSSKTIEFRAGPIPKGKTPYVFFKARIPTEKVAGYFPTALLVELNGKTIEGLRISNRPPVSTMMRGDEDVYIQDDGHLAVWYSPSFKAVEEHALYALADGVKACEFELAVHGLLKQGDNRLVFRNTAYSVPVNPRTVFLGEVALRIKSQLPPGQQLAAAPTGEIPTWEPRQEFPKTYTDFTQRQARVEFGLNGQPFVVASRFSAPDGQWYEGSCKFFEHIRQVIQHDEWFVVRDTLRNLTNEDLPVRQSHKCALGKRQKGLWLGGVRIPSQSGVKHSPGNPSVFATTERAGIGMLALNDEFKVHIVQACDRGTIELADRGFVLKPKAEYTAEWAVFPAAKPDLWRFINTARRMLNVNFEVKWMFAFMMGAEPVHDWTEGMFADFAKYKSANFVVQSIYGPSKSRWKGRNPYSTSFLKVDHGYYREFHKRLRKLFPDGSVKHGIYYHCFIDNYDGNEIRFKDDRRLDSAGNHINYGGRYTYDRLYVPTLDNEFGKETAKVVDAILDEIGADGIFWDEFCTSRGEYTYNRWDGCSADIDQTTGKITRKKGHVALLSRDWRARQVKRMMDHGPLVCSGAPFTQAMAKLKYQAFCETGSITRCRGMLLWTPIALGDHITEKTQKDTYRHMLKTLDNGCLYAWYDTHIRATHKTLTEQMYPFTPVELHAGVLIGKERILTNRSGYFGWGDASAFRAHVFDRDGKETDEIKVLRVVRDAKAYAEVRIPEGFSAALVRETK